MKNHSSVTGPVASGDSVDRMSCQDTNEPMKASNPMVVDFAISDFPEGTFLFEFCTGFSHKVPCFCPYS